MWWTKRPDSEPKNQPEPVETVSRVTLDLCERVANLEAKVQNIVLEAENIYEKTHSALARMNKRWRDLIEHQETPEVPAATVNGDVRSDRLAALRRRRQG